MLVDFQKAPHPGIRALVPYKPGKSIEELAQEQGLSDIIKLASNENPLGCSPKALEALRTLPSHTIATYPSPLLHPLMQQLATHHQLTPEQLFLSNGSDYIFGLLLQCFALHTQKHMLTHDYAFSTYAIQAHALNIPVRTVPIKKNWEVDIQAIIDACTEDTALVFLANPNNPTGLLIPQEKILHLLRHIPPTTLLVLDEAYFEFAASEMSCNSIEWLQQYNNLVITRTFSKIYGMAGLRIGYAMGHPDVMAILKRVQLPFMVNQGALAAAVAALNDHEFLQQSLDSTQEGINRMRADFNALGINYLPSSCNFLTFDCQEDSASLYNQLLKQGIIVRPLHAYNMNQYIRVTIGTKEQNRRFIEALKKCAPKKKE